MHNSNLQIIIGIESIKISTVLILKVNRMWGRSHLWNTHLLRTWILRTYQRDIVPQIKRAIIKKFSDTYDFDNESRMDIDHSWNMSCSSSAFVM